MQALILMSGKTRVSELETSIKFRAASIRNVDKKIFVKMIWFKLPRLVVVCLLGSNYRCC